MIYQLKLLASFLIISGSICASSAYIEQYVSNVISFSSQYTSTRYSANQIIGNENFYPEYGNSENTWCASTRQSTEYIEVEFLEEVYIEKIEVYETFDPGSITTLGVWNGTSYVIVYGGDVNFTTTSRIFTPCFETLTFKSKRVRLDYDATGTHPRWVEIDAMKVSGKKEPADGSIDITAVCQLCEHYANECNVPKCIFHKT